MHVGRAKAPARPSVPCLLNLNVLPYLALSLLGLYSYVSTSERARLSWRSRLVSTILPIPKLVRECVSGRRNMVGRDQELLRGIFQNLHFSMNLHLHLYDAYPKRRLSLPHRDPPFLVVHPPALPLRLTHSLRQVHQDL